MDMLVAMYVLFTLGVGADDWDDGTALAGDEREADVVVTAEVVVLLATLTLVEQLLLALALLLGMLAVVFPPLGVPPLICP